MCDLLDDNTCQSCHGEGFVVTCCDDLCANTDHCIHGDGEDPCSECQATGVTPCPCPENEAP